VTLLTKAEAYLDDPRAYLDDRSNNNPATPKIPIPRENASILILVYILLSPHYLNANAARLLESQLLAEFERQSPDIEDSYAEALDIEPDNKFSFKYALNNIQS